MSLARRPSSSRFRSSEPRHLSPEAARRIVDRVLSLSHADEALVSMGSWEEGSTRFARNEVTTSGDAYRHELAVTSAIGRRKGTAVTTVLTEAGLRAVVDESEAIGRLMPESEEHVPVLGAQDYLRVAGWYAASATLDATRRAAAAATATVPAADRGLSAAGVLVREAGARAVGTSQGLFAYHRGTEVDYTLTVRADDGRGSGWASAGVADWARVNASAVSEAAIDKAVRSRDPQPIEPGRITVILEPAAVAALIQPVIAALSAREAEEGRSFFRRPGGGTRLGERVFDPRISLRSDPQDPEVPLAPFDDEGLPRRAVEWVRDGVLQELVWDRYWAVRRDRAPTAAPAGIRMSGGATTVDEMVRATRRGVLVTRVWYLRLVDPRTLVYTGLSRDGTFLVENGRITRPVLNLRFNESLPAVLDRIDAIGPEVRVNSGMNFSDDGLGTAVVCPPLLVREFNFTARSDAI